MKTKRKSKNRAARSCAPSPGSANFVGYAVMLTRRDNGEMFVAHGPEGTRAIYLSRFDAVAFKRALAEHKMKARVVKVRVELSSPNGELKDSSGGRA
jgi:hypothetical protein